MRREWLSVALCVLCVTAGCVGTPDRARSGSEPTVTTAPTSSDARTESRPTTRSSSPADAQISNASAGERAISAEQDRIRAATSDWENLTDLSFGILRPATYSVVRRNESGVLLSVEVGYSMAFACGPDDDPTDSVDGASTKTRYVVSADDTRLVDVRRDVYPPNGAFCG